MVRSALTMGYGSAISRTTVPSPATQVPAAGVVSARPLKLVTPGAGLWSREPTNGTRTQLTGTPGWRGAGAGIIPRGFHLGHGTISGGRGARRGRRHPMKRAHLLTDPNAHYCLTPAGSSPMRPRARHGQLRSTSGLAQ
jgi:hypothetical protein